ncbi:putative short chain oxidoreductase/dehydrogenase [Colletotrichum godetiae]|uniref:Short chain oxidoreductase/dehydrogenase n=1 Tax=Colletotrichum godetiae TaxID=1209918 RepID=A0AAJ0F329_9PEZI|nr:putative short chain oxidoreductase/dehydrogenase [Colletotrichum godetiae]KAK1701221.1 putative short chain oxidoreductase/dehydrogenase [Colletotrichum godetiae]
MTQLVWLITGCSSGLGLELSREVLRRGHLVIASSRSLEKTPHLVNEIQQAGGHWIALDVTKDSVQQQVDSAAQIHGRIDVLVNNAGYGIAGGFEDLSLTDFQTLFNTNLYGTIRTTQAALPHMRAAHTGTIINISSTGGLRGLAAVSAYASSKFALEGLSESLAAEYAADFNIRVVLVEPGPFRTLFRDQPTFSPAAGRMSEFYKGTAAEGVLKHLESGGGTQAGDPVRAARQMFDFVAGQGLAEGLLGGQEEEKEKKGGRVLRLPLGKAAVKTARDKVADLERNIDAVAHIANACDFDE